VLKAVVPDGQFLTMVYARLNRAAMRLTLVQAAHPPAIHVPGQGQPRPVELEGDVLGVFDSAVFDQKELVVSPGDRIFLLSDGVIEVGDGRADHRQGLRRLCAAIDRHRASPLDQAVEPIVADALDGSLPTDDIVLMGVDV
jgi:sigma-B regulation protein RsbU (phosphoserine phosphatase)